MSRYHPWFHLWTGLPLLLLLLAGGRGQAAEPTPIPRAELGARAEAQQPTPAPVIAPGRATLAAPLQALRGEVGPDGLRVISVSASEGGGDFRLVPQALSKGAAPLALPPGTLSARDTAVVLDRGPLREVFAASADGLRQDFVVAAAPPGAGPLTLTQALTGASAQTDGEHLVLTLPGGRRLVYGGLHITDADGRVLSGTLASPDPRTLVIAVADAGARYPITIDPTINDADWQIWNPGLPGANGTIYALAFNGDGTRLFVGGDFTAIGTVLANRIAQWDGSVWSALGAGLNGTVFALAASGGTLYAGGAFTAEQGDPVVGTLNRIARWTGGAWSRLGAGLDDTVFALAVSGGTLYAGGSFTARQGGTGGTLNFIAQWNGSAWSALGAGLSSSVYALAASGGTLYAGGVFYGLQGGPAGTLNFIAQWNGSAWSALGAGLNGTVSALAVSGGTLYAGGGFTALQGGTAGTLNRVAQWTGSTWSALGAGLNDTVNALAVSGGTLYAGGTFTALQGGTAGTLNRIAHWDGSAWSALGSGMDSTVQALANAGNALYVGGAFLTAGGKFSPYAAYVVPSCGPGVAYTTGRWQQLSLPCQPAAASPTVASEFALAPSANLPLASYASQWVLYGRTAGNNGNLALTTASPLAVGPGYWFKSLVDPVGNQLQIVGGTATPVQSGVTGCQSLNGCVVTSVYTSGTAGTRMIGNPFPYNVDWSRVRVRVNGLDLYTPSAANTAKILSNQIWIWNGNAYDSWTDTAPSQGNLKYFQSFFIKVLPDGAGQTIELLIPAAPSGLSARAPAADRLLAAARAWGAALADWLVPSAAAAEDPATGGWAVELRAENPRNGFRARGQLGQWSGAEPGYDPADLAAMAPFASPYLTLVFPQPAWGVKKGDYTTDLRPADGWPGQWTFEVRADTAGAPLVLRWQGPALVLARSRLTDLQSGQVIDPADPAWAGGYPFTLDPKVRRFGWEYLGD